MIDDGAEMQLKKGEYFSRQPTILNSTCGITRCTLLYR